MRRSSLRDSRRTVVLARRGALAGGAGEGGAAVGRLRAEDPLGDADDARSIVRWPRLTRRSRTCLTAASVSTHHDALTSSEPLRWLMPL